MYVGVDGIGGKMNEPVFFSENGDIGEVAEGAVD